MRKVENTIHPIIPVPQRIQMIGGQGIELYDTGIIMGKGAGLAIYQFSTDRC
jgi:hypothetical protein